MTNRYPKLTKSQAEMLDAIPFSEEKYGVKYHPCSVQLKSGEIRDRVYLCAARSWFELWGVWPEDDLYQVPLITNRCAHSRCPIDMIFQG